jgi:hypothetical protein
MKGCSGKLDRYNHCKCTEYISNTVTKDYLPHVWLYPSTDLAQFHGTVFVFCFLQIFVFSDFQLFRPEYH